MGTPDRTSVGWTPGPADASLGDLASIKIPEGYRFTDANGARSLLKQMKNPVPKGLVGILAPKSGQWWAVLTYKDVGYVKDAGKDRIDPKAILQTISDRAQRQNDERAIHGLAPISSVKWELPPVFDAKAHTVEWAVAVKIHSTQVVNHTMRLLGRRGVLDATVVEPYKAGTALAPLKELMKDISFKPGQRYTDYQKGDTVADIGLAGLIAGQDDSPVAQKKAVATAAKSAGTGSWGWYEYVGIGVLAGGSVLLLRGGMRRRRRKARRALAASSVNNGISSGNGAGGKELAHQHASAISQAPVEPGNASTLAETKPIEVKLGERKHKEVIARNGSHHRRGARRKRVFDYHRFYTDTVMKLSSGTYAEVAVSNGHADGNGQVNGHSFDQTSQPPTHGEANQALVQAHLDLIANQKELIEEQKRLMVQQARLIEEKSKLIAEKSQLLDRQTELFERDLL